MKLFSALYERVLTWSKHRHAERYLAALSFAESSFFPIPPDVMLIPMVLAERAKAWAYATLCTLSSVIGGIAGYAIGLFLFEVAGKPMLDFYGYGEKFAHFASQYNEFGGWIVFFAGVTPFPYKVITIASGATELNFMIFMVASIAARGLRFFAVSGLLFWFGPPIRTFIERRFGLVTTLFLVMLFAGFIAIKYLV